jgi:hypothetical protein
MLVLLNKYYFIKSMVEDRFDSNLEMIVLLEAADDGGGNLKVTCKLTLHTGTGTRPYFEAAALSVPCKTMVYYNGPLYVMPL